MAVYNCENTVSEAIESILNQTFQDFELIICDDCSTDTTYEVVMSYYQKNRDKIILLRNSQNSKLAYSLNKCLQHARGEYVARMDGDDISLPERLDKQVRFLESNPKFDLVGSSMIVFDQNGDRLKVVGKEVPDKYDLTNNPTFNHATILVKKRVFDILGGYTVSRRTTRTEDYDLWFKFFSKDFRGYNLEEVLYKARLSDKDLMRRTFHSRLQGAYTAFCGFRLLKLPLKYYIYCFKPLLAGFIPRSMMMRYHRKKYS